MPTFTRTNELMAACQQFAPTKSAEQAFAQTALSMQLGGCTDREVALALAEGLVDGLRYGNWPQP